MARAVAPGGRGALTPRRAWLLAVALTAAFSFTGLSNHPLRASDEPRVAGIAWEMQHEGTWLVPHLGGEPFLEHPPLFYATLGAFIRGLGATDGVARLPGAIASALTLLLVFALGSRLAGRGAGLCALLALVCMRGFFRYSHKVLVDPMLMLFVALAFAAYVRATWPAAGGASAAESEERVRAPWLVLVYVAAALAFAVKGLVGIVAAGGPIAVHVLAGRRWSALRSPAHAVGLPLLVLACVSWPLLLQHVEGEAAAREFLLANGLYRVVPSAAGAGDYRGGHINAWWYYLPRIVEQVGWPVVFIPAVAVWLVREREPSGWNLPALRFLASVLPVGVVLLSIPGTKRGLYLLPFLPPFAVAVGAWVAAAGAGLLEERGLLGARAPRLRRGLRAWSPHALAVGFAVSVAWNVVAYPFVGGGRDLGPFSREVDARVGAGPLAGFWLPEEMRGALPFYTGRIAVNFTDPSALERFLADGRCRFVVAPSIVNVDHVVEKLVPVDAWQGAELGYTLYAMAGGRPGASPGEGARGGASATPASSP